jgi:endonuclease/exonuclease/phosphatase family metal-dependent hydrolase
MTPTGPEDSYPQQAKELIELLPRDELPTVVAGDFNASSRNAQHVENVASLGARGLKSAYDDFFGAPHTYPGDHPTSYHQWNEGLPHHMDYVFLPSRWKVQDVRVGTYAEYSATKRSDHMPMTVVAFPN